MQSDADSAPLFVTGILPRNLDPVPQTGYTASTNSLVPLSRELRVRKGEVSVKYCETCRLYRAPRSSHCRLCGNCVEGIDHHCTYLHNCIGRRNYASFVAFLVSAVLCLVYSIVFAAMHYVLLCHREGRTFVQALGVSPESGVNFVLGLVLLAPILALLGYHLHVSAGVYIARHMFADARHLTRSQLMLINSTTVERVSRASSRGSFEPSVTDVSPVLTPTDPVQCRSISQPGRRSFQPLCVPIASPQFRLHALPTSTPILDRRERLADAGSASAESWFETDELKFCWLPIRATLMTFVDDTT